MHIYLTIPVEQLKTILEKAQHKGYRAIVVTCDDPTYRVREYVFPLFEEASKNIDPKIHQILSRPNMKAPSTLVERDISDIPMTWANVEELRQLTTLPIICKGILSPIDAELAIKYGANGIIVRSISTIILLDD